MSIIEKGVPFFEKLFQFPYPLPKLDLVAIPDFAAGAMENWGLMTFRTSKLLSDPQAPDIETKERVADAVLHELSHQWLGNLVTMAGWTQLWLKEGLATLMAWYARSKLFPDDHIWPSFVAEVQQVSLGLDCLRASHPVEMLAVDREEVSQIFDNISYKKGASLLLMLLNALGPEAFFNGIRLYLQRHQYSSASSDDLWRAFEDIDRKGSLLESMHIWTREQGFPVIKVITDPTLPVQGGQVQSFQSHVHIIQNRFLAMETPLIS